MNVAPRLSTRIFRLRTDALVDFIDTKFLISDYKHPKHLLEALHLMTDTEYEDPFGAELGAFDIVADSSAATARQQRIEAARKAARSYQAKVEEPGVRPSPPAFFWQELTAVVRG